MNVGDRVTTFADVRLGDVLCEVNHQFDATNTLVVQRLDRRRGIFYAVFVAPDDPYHEKRLAGDRQFAVWAFDLRMPEISEYTLVQRKDAA